MGRKVKASWLAALRRAAASPPCSRDLSFGYYHSSILIALLVLPGKLGGDGGSVAHYAVQTQEEAKLFRGGGGGKGGGHRQRPAYEGPGEHAESLRPGGELDPNILNCKRNIRVSLQFLPERPGIYKSVQVAPHAERAELRSQVRSFRIISKWLI